MAPILRTLLPVGALSADAATGSIVGPLGRSEIQEAAQAFAQGDSLGRAYLETRSEVVGALADGCAAWLRGGSRVSGDAQALLCVQQRLACSVGINPTGEEVRAPVAWIAGRRATKFLKPIDDIILGVMASRRAVTKVNAQVASKVSNPRGRARKSVGCEGGMERRTDLGMQARHSGGVEATARWQGHAKQLEKLIVPPRNRRSKEAVYNWSTQEIGGRRRGWRRGS